MSLSANEIAQKIKSAQRARKNKVPLPKWFKKYSEEYAPRLQLRVPTNPKSIPFGYSAWQDLCQDLEKYGAETINIFHNVRQPGTTRKPVFYKFTDQVVEKESHLEVKGVYIRICNVGTPQTAVIEMAVAAPPEVVQDIHDLLKLGTSRPHKLVYLYAENHHTNGKVKIRLVKQANLDTLKMRLLWLFKAGYGVSFRNS